MPKEYRTIQEVAGPLMLVKGVKNVAYDELGEIELFNGEKAPVQGAGINEGNALVQLFESSTGINLEAVSALFGPQHGAGGQRRHAGPGVRRQDAP